MPAGNDGAAATVDVASAADMTAVIPRRTTLLLRAVREQR
jgi:hypothetical protein